MLRRLSTICGASLERHYIFILSLNCCTQGSKEVPQQPRACPRNLPTQDAPRAYRNDRVTDRHEDDRRAFCHLPAFGRHIYLTTTGPQARDSQAGQTTARRHGERCRVRTHRPRGGIGRHGDLALHRPSRADARHPAAGGRPPRRPKALGALEAGGAPPMRRSTASWSGKASSPR